MRGAVRSEPPRFSTPRVHHLIAPAACCETIENTMHMLDATSLGRRHLRLGHEEHRVGAQHARGGSSHTAEQDEVLEGGRCGIILGEGGAQLASCDACRASPCDRGSSTCPSGPPDTPGLAKYVVYDTLLTMMLRLFISGTSPAIPPTAAARTITGRREATAGLPARRAAF